MTLLTSVNKCLRKYITFSGRAGRAEFWNFVLGIFTASVVLSIARLWTHNQKITVAARAMAERKTLGLRS
jgi:uncharacterized membrane protein YhaH (DUF805 family)